MQMWWMKLLGLVTLLVRASSVVLSTSSSSAFLGQILHRDLFGGAADGISNDRFGTFVPRSYLVMRKQKASDKRTTRRQRGLGVEEESSTTTSVSTLTVSPMQQRGKWNAKAKPYPTSSATTTASLSEVSGGRGRSRKRSSLYSALSFYHDKFLNLLTREYKAEEEEVLGRIKGSIDDPLSLERAGYALYDMYPTRRGNLFTDEVYRLTKARDATTTFSSSKPGDEATGSSLSGLPPGHKFSVNDVIMVTRQPHGSGDLFDPSSLPISETAQKMEARVLGVGPTYIDIVVGAGDFETAFGQPAPNDMSGKGDRRLRVRVDCFFSPVPYERMVTALAQISQIPPTSSMSVKRDVVTAAGGGSSNGPTTTNRSKLDLISADTALFRELIIGTHSFGDPDSPSYQDASSCNLDEIANMISKPPMVSSMKLANEVVRYIQSNPQIFRSLNAPQIAAIQAALARRCTLIQGPPGTGKTTVAAAIGFGFVHQCRSLSVHTKVLACAFSNVGADNLAEALIKLGLKVVRIGKPSAVSQSLWNNTIDAAIDRDPDAQKALAKAAKTTAALSKLQRSKSASGGAEDRTARQAATSAVQASTQACNLAATKAFRRADVIVSTSTGAADARLLAACGLNQQSEEEENTSSTSPVPQRRLAPDGLSPLSLPFVIVDEACQSVEPATLIPLISSNSCRSVVLLGDPCQLPPTVRHTASSESSLSISLMERLAVVLPDPNIRSKIDNTEYDTSFLGALPIRQARSLVLNRNRNGNQLTSYRKRFAGSFMLSVQYRMHPSIAAFPSGIFYDGMLSTPLEMAAARPSPPILSSLLPLDCDGLGVRVVHVGGRFNERQWSGTNDEQQGTSFANEREANLVVDLLIGILGDKEGDVETVAVISPYLGQVQLIQSLIASNNYLAKPNATTTVEVKSVDSFQGRERDVVIFSAVRSNREGNVGFLHDWRRLNVALTRARKALVVIGDFDTLAPSDTNWAALQKWATAANCVIDSSTLKKTQIL